MKILVLGGGAQGRVIAADLARARPGDQITVADLRAPRLPTLPNLGWLEIDLAEPANAVRLLGEHDFGVGALPARFGFATMRAAIEARRPLVDVSFCAQDALRLDPDARAAGIAILPDCGLAPGLSNLIAGEAVARRGVPNELVIMVGGVAQDRTRPYGYVVTWSLDDLQEEYERPARIVSGGRPTTVPVFSGCERVSVDGVGDMEAFYSDGLRTLIETLPGVREMGEKTLRWPGHADAMRPLLATGRFIEEMRAHCVVEPPLDLVAMRVRARWNGRAETTTLVDRYDLESGLSAMSRTTALTTSAVAQLVAGGFPVEPGVRPLELVTRARGSGAAPGAYEFVRAALERHGVSWTRRDD
jgi:saccharopine dehydrogenase-like NADP-dependent oxidoreductase